MPVAIKTEDGIKDYYTVAERIKAFRGEFGTDSSIITEIISNGTEVVVKAKIVDKEGRVVSTGFASEERDSTFINKTSALENAETSAIGRALANFGLSGTEYASAEEVTNALINQERNTLLKDWAEYMALVREHWDTIDAIRTNIAVNDLQTAIEAWYELSEKDMIQLWKAPSKGGVFTTKERETMKSDEWSEVRKEYKSSVSNEG